MNTGLPVSMSSGLDRRDETKRSNHTNRHVQQEPRPSSDLIHSLHFVGRLVGWLVLLDFCTLLFILCKKFLQAIVCFPITKYNNILKSIVSSSLTKSRRTKYSAILRSPIPDKRPDLVIIYEKKISVWSYLPKPLRSGRICHKVNF